MAHTIADNCIACGSCVDSCPVQAISEGTGKYTIDAGKCIDCGSCVEQCPVEAIKPPQ